MGQAESQFIQEHDASKKDSTVEQVVQKYWKKFDRKMVGIVLKSGAKKFLKLCYDFWKPGKEKDNVEEKNTTVARWYKYLDPQNEGVIGWSEVKAFISTGSPLNEEQLRQQFKQLMIKYHTLNLEVVAAKEQAQTLEGRLAILQTQMEAQQSLMEAKKKRHRNKKKAATNDNLSAIQAQHSDDTVFASEVQSSSTSSEESQEDVKPEVSISASTGSIKKEKKKVAGGLDDEMIADIIFGMDKAFEHSKQNVSAPDIDIITPEEYSFEDQLLLHRKEDELLKFKYFSPKVFHHIRELFEIKESDIMKSFTPDNLIQVKGEGKSGAFLLITKDHRFILKTATKEERDYLWYILPNYLKYIKNQRETLLPRILCVFSMKHEGIGGVTRFFIMNNVFNSNLHYDPLEKYDLKGSIEGRFVPEKKRDRISTLKDQDILNNNRKLYIPDDVMKPLLQQIESDSKFLAAHKIMDYSFLVGIHYETPENKEELARRAANELKKKKEDRDNTFYPNKFQEEQGGILGYNKEKQRKEYYYIGIIDILMQYTTRKKAEHLLRAIVQEGNQVSTVPPDYYQGRFVQFVQGVLEPIPADVVPKDKKDTEYEQCSKKKRKESKGRSIAREEKEGSDKLVVDLVTNTNERHHSHDIVRAAVKQSNSNASLGDVKGRTEKKPEKKDAEKDDDKKDDATKKLEEREKSRKKDDK